MIPKKEHIKVINKFFDELEKLDKGIEMLRDPYEEEGFNEERYDLLRRWMNMTDIWMMMDDCLESIDNQINIALQEDPELFERYRKR